MELEILNGNCRVSFFLEFKRPPYVAQNAYEWGTPISRALDHILGFERVCEVDDSICGTYVVFEYETLDELLTHAQGDKEWLEEEWREEYPKQLKEEERLLTDRLMREEAEELDFLIEQALG